MSGVHTLVTSAAEATVGFRFMFVAFKKDVRLVLGMGHHFRSNPPPKGSGREISLAGRVIVLLVGVTLVGIAISGLLKLR